MIYKADFKLDATDSLKIVAEKLSPDMLCGLSVLSIVLFGANALLKTYGTLDLEPATDPRLDAYRKVS